MHFVDRSSRHWCHGAEGDGDEPIFYLAHQGVRIGLEEGERFLGPSPVLFGISGFRSVCCSMVLVLPGPSRKWRRIHLESVALRGTSADAPWCECRAQLVQDGANAMIPEKIQGATISYG